MKIIQSRYIVPKSICYRKATKSFKKYAEEVTIIGYERISSDIVLPERFKRDYIEEGFGRVFIRERNFKEYFNRNMEYLNGIKTNCRIIY